MKKTEPEYYPPVENLLDLIYEHYTENNPVEKNTVAGKAAKAKEKELDENQQVICKSSMRSFLRTYSFIAAVMPFKSLEWEMLDTYFSLLIHKLPLLKGEDFTLGLLDAVDFDKYRITKNEERRIELENEDTAIEPIPVGNPRGKTEPEMAKLSDILDEWNNLNFSNVEKAKEQLEELPHRLEVDTSFVNAARNSNRETAMQQCANSLMMIVAAMLNENTEFCRYYLDNPEFKNAINQRVFEAVYSRLTDGCEQTVNITNNFNGHIDKYVAEE